ncbi:MAG: rhodanese-like domain-containing protein [Cellulomonadaceae bacterium]|jgi:rhodanese-related sulfurtransferase|nr:rhodanese-like domain-containing protein [Cellulomonadaceae bacterium]
MASHKMIRRAMTVLMAMAVALSIGFTTTSCSPPGPTVIDVRTAEEFAQSHVDGARNIDFTQPDFEARIRTLPASAQFIVYCNAGNRSGEAATMMTDNGLDVIDAQTMQNAATLVGAPIISGP